MKKADYLALRKSLDLKKKWLPLLFFYCTDSALVYFFYFFIKSNLNFFAILTLAILMFRNFALMHDASHYSLCENKRLNNLLGFVSGCVSLLPFKTWRTSHMQHHIWSGNMTKDPVMALRINLPKMPKNLQYAINTTWKLWIPLIAFLQFTLFWKLSCKIAIQSKSKLLIIETLAPLLIWAGLILFSPLHFSITILLPALTLYLLINEIVNLPHHLQMPILNNDNKLNYWEQNQSSRSCIYPKWISTFLTLDFNLHAEHHMFPDAPWYALSDIHEKLKDSKDEIHYVDILLGWTIKNRSKDIIDIVTEECVDTPEILAS